MIAKIKYDQLWLRKKDERYEIYDLHVIGGITFSITHLYPNKSTTGHEHPHGEIYFFFNGRGHIYVGKEDEPVTVGDVVVIPGNTFHRVLAGDSGVEFVCVFPEERPIEDLIQRLDFLLKQKSYKRQNRV